MGNNITKIWFDWFYTNWKKFTPGELIEEGILPSQIAERFVNINENDLLNLAKKFDDENYEALKEFINLSESELHILKYFLKLVKIKKISRENH